MLRALIQPERLALKGVLNYTQYSSSQNEESNMTDRPVKGDNPDYNPRKKTHDKQPKDDERNAP